MANFLEKDILYNSTISNSENEYKTSKYNYLLKKCFFLKNSFNDFSH